MIDNQIFTVDWFEVIINYSGLLFVAWDPLDAPLIVLSNRWAALLDGDCVYQAVVLYVLDLLLAEYHKILISKEVYYLHMIIIKFESSADSDFA